MTKKKKKVAQLAYFTNQLTEFVLLELHIPEWKSRLCLSIIFTPSRFLMLNRPAINFCWVIFVPKNLVWRFSLHWRKWPENLEPTDTISTERKDSFIYTCIKCLPLARYHTRPWGFVTCLCFESDYTWVHSQFIYLQHDNTLKRNQREEILAVDNFTMTLLKGAYWEKKKKKRNNKMKLKARADFREFMVRPSFCILLFCINVYKGRI